MTNIIENTYKTLANTGELDLTEKEYSTRYLGRCKSCYAYLKSTTRQASTDVLMKLWANLRLAEKRGERRGFRFKKPQPNQLQKTARKMSERVLEEVLVRSTVCRTPAKPPCNQL